jgi:hypothetical protein
MKEEGRRKKEEGRRKKEEGRRKKEFFVLTDQQKKSLILNLSL